MNQYLFSIGLGVEEAPERWAAICTIYARLARGLTKLGHRCVFIVNPRALDKRPLRGFETHIGTHDNLSEIIKTNRPGICFIWGGRIAADKKTIEILSRYGVKPIFSELGWFPQKGTIYFDELGTNTSMSFTPPPDLSDRNRFIFQIRRAIACQRIYRRPVNRTPPVGAARRVFIPLQDESDTNILLDSPFGRMDDMLAMLSRTYPDVFFVARRHPKADTTRLRAYANVEIQPPGVNLYRTLPDFDLVLGVNSTVLTEAAFLGHPVLCLGDGIAKIYGLAHSVDANNPPRTLAMRRETPQITDALAFLYLTKQLQQKSLSSTRYLMSSYLRALLCL